MKLIPLKSADELVREYEQRCIEKIRRERLIRRIPGAILLFAYVIGFSLMVGGIVRYVRYAEGGSTYYGAGPHSDAGDNEP